MSSAVTRSQLPLPSPPRCRRHFRRSWLSPSRSTLAPHTTPSLNRRWRGTRTRTLMPPRSTMRRRHNGDRHSGELSMWQPIHLGVDEAGYAVRVVLAERNLLVGGEPGAGKSSVLNLVAAHAALSIDCDLILIDGKQVELGPWRACATRFVGPSLTDAIDCLIELQTVMDGRYAALLDAGDGRRKL